MPQPRYGQPPSLAVDFDAASESYAFGDLATVPDSDVDFTIEGWFYFTSLAGFKEILGKATTTTGWYVLSPVAGSSALEIAFDDARVALNGVTLTTNTWTYLCWVHRASANTVQGYYGTTPGKLKIGTLTTGIAGPTTSSGAMRVGSQDAFPTDGGIVRMAFVRVWSTALREDQIKRVWNRRFLLQESPYVGLAFLWDANLDAGSAPLDQVTQTVGTLIGTPTPYYAGPALPVAARRWLVTEEATGGTGSAAVDESADVLASAATLAIAGVLTKTEAGDTSAATATLAIAGSAALTAAADTLSSSAALAIVGVLTKTEAGDSVGAAGTLALAGVLTKTEAADTSGATAALALSASAALTEAADTLVAAGSGAANTGIAAIVEAADSGAATGALALAGALSVTEAANTVSATATLALSGALSATETGDTVSASGIIQLAGAAFVTEAGDSISATGACGIAGLFAAAEAPDVLSASGYAGVAFVPPTPLERWFPVSAEARAYAVLAEDRAYAIPLEDRGFAVLLEDRAVVIPTEDRTFAV